MVKLKLIPLPGYRKYSAVEMSRRSEEFYREIKGRRTVREFSDRSIPLEIIKNCLQAAATSPSGANRQPWHFVVVTNPEVKKEIRMAAEREESDFYKNRAPAEWLKVLEPLGVDENKPFLEKAPYLIVIFSQSYEVMPNSRKLKNYYVQESVGIACGILITALHHAGLATLTHTPAPMKFLNKILNRPPNERPYMILVVGHPAKDTRVPDIQKKPLEEIVDFVA